MYYIYIIDCMYQFYIGLRQSTYIIILVSCSDSLSMLSVFGEFPVSIHVSGFSHEKLFPRTTQPFQITQGYGYTRNDGSLGGILRNVTLFEVGEVKSVCL